VKSHKDQEPPSEEHEGREGTSADVGNALAALPCRFR